MKRRIKKEIEIIFIPIIIFIIYFIFDYFNIPNLLKIEISNINNDIFAIMLNSLIVIVLYMISYYFIDNRQNKKDENSCGIAKILFNNTYQMCIDNLKLIDNSSFVEKYIIPKIDGKKSARDNDIISNLLEFPFESYDTILTLAVNGHINKHDLDEYLFIKKEYFNLVSMKIIFYDAKNSLYSKENFLKEKIDVDYNLLYERLKNIINNNDN